MTTESVSMHHDPRTVSPEIAESVTALVDFAKTSNRTHLHRAVDQLGKEWLGLPMGATRDYVAQRRAELLAVSRGERPQS